MDGFIAKKLKQNELRKSQPYYFINIDKSVDGESGGGVYNGADISGMDDMARELEESLNNCGSNLFCSNPTSYVAQEKLERAFNEIQNGGESTFKLTIVCKVTIGKK